MLIADLILNPAVGRTSRLQRAGVVEIFLGVACTQLVTPSTAPQLHGRQFDQRVARFRQSLTTLFLLIDAISNLEEAGNIG
jgi:hypothetical protein